ncbi:hypothetical protein HLB44_16845 [Aquincola sp. S2]|uniref:MarR family transcriptional regulator n=1 Tax=Pseudaquabacterium terrae TaxID=2732868 RepID=A0ABX2EJB4_9BURK|nr:hypothetical protein [Aquabacterium terrae]NRF68662.1 hypothetical protein [Aquabacterium terrae]
MDTTDLPQQDCGVARAAGALAGAGGPANRRAEPAVLMFAATGRMPESDADLHHLVRMLGDLSMAVAWREYHPRAALLAEQFRDCRRIKMQVQVDALRLARDMVAAGRIEMTRRGADAAIVQVRNVAGCLGMTNVANDLIADRRRAFDAVARKYGCTLQTLAAEHVAEERLGDLFADLRRLEAELQEGDGC